MTDNQAPGVFITAAAVADFFDAHTLEAAGWIRRDENGAWQSPASMSQAQAEEWCDANRRSKAGATRIRMWLDYSKLTPQELADLQAMMEKMQVPDDGEADAKDGGGVGPKEG